MNSEQLAKKLIAPIKSFVREILIFCCHHYSHFIFGSILPIFGLVVARFVPMPVVNDVLKSFIVNQYLFLITLLAIVIRSLQWILENLYRAKNRTNALQPHWFYKVTDQILESAFAYLNAILNTGYSITLGVFFTFVMLTMNEPCWSARILDNFHILLMCGIFIIVTRILTTRESKFFILIERKPILSYAIVIILSIAAMLLGANIVEPSQSKNSASQINSSEHHRHVLCYDRRF